MAQHNWPSISVGSASADSRGRLCMSPLSKITLFSDLCSIVHMPYSFYPNIIFTLKIPSYLNYGLLWHEDNFFISLSCILLRFFPLKWITQSLLLLSHLDPKFIFPQKQPYTLGLYSLFNKFVRRILCSNVDFPKNKFSSISEYHPSSALQKFFWKHSFY